MSPTHPSNDAFEEDSRIRLELELTEQAIDYLREAAKWAKFLAIIGFIMTGFIALFGLFLSSIMSSLPLGAGGLTAGTMSAMTFIYLLLAVVYFFPTLYFYRFATQTRAAIDTYNADGLAEGLGNLKSTFKFMGIMMIILLGVYGLMIGLSVIAALFSPSA